MISRKILDSITIGHNIQKKYRYHRRIYRKILGVLQPVIRLSERIDENRKSFESYKRLSDQFDELEFRIQKDKSLTVDQFTDSFALALRKIDSGGSSRVKLNNRCKKNVDKELPPDNWKISYISPQKILRSSY